MPNGAPQKFVVLALAAALCVAACSKRDDAGKPSTIPPLDPAAAPSPPPALAMPPAPPPARAAEATPPAAAAAPGSDVGASITGSIVLSPAIAKLRHKTGTLYLVARQPSDNPSVRGTMIAVKKLPATTFPLPFALTAADMPFQNGPFEGELVLTARIDQDGDPLTYEKGDVFGKLPKVSVGAHGVKLALDQVQKETESLAGGAPIMGGLGGPAPEQPQGTGELPPGHPRLPAGHP
jgi:hypothetical protein